MKDPATVLGIAIYNKLFLQIISNTAQVMIYDEMAEDGAQFPRLIILDAQTGPQIGTKISFRTVCSVVIKASMAFDRDVTKNITNDIINQVSQLLIPAPYGPFITVPGFKVILTELVSASNNSYQDMAKKYIDRNARFEFTLEQTDLT